MGKVVKQQKKVPPRKPKKQAPRQSGKKPQVVKQNNELGQKMKTFFNKHNPRVYIGKKVQKMFEGIYHVSDKVKYKIAETTMVLNNPFSAQFYQDRCNIQ